MFRWALSQDIVEIDPTAGLKAYDPGTPRDRVLTVEEIGALWKWIDSDALPRNPADILKLELLIGARCGEISGLCVEEIDRDEWIWTLPAARSKNKRPRVTPLVGVARQIVETRLSIVSSAVATQLTEMGVALDLVAAVIGHEAGGRETRTLVRHYAVLTDLLDRKRSSLEAWQRRLSEIIEGKSLRGNVTQFAGTRAA